MESEPKAFRNQFNCSGNCGDVHGSADPSLSVLCSVVSMEEAELRKSPSPLLLHPPQARLSFLLLHQTTRAIMANVRKTGTRMRMVSVSSGGSTHITCSVVQLEKKCLCMRMM